MAAAKTRAQLLAELEALRQREEQYRSLVEHLPIAVAHTDPDGGGLYHNPHAQRMMGYTPQELAGMRAEQFYVHPEDRQDLIRNLEEKGEHSYEYQLRRKDGRIIWVRGTTRAVRRPDGSIAYFEGFSEDITAHRRVERRREARQQVREAIWRMQSSQDVEQVLETVRDRLQVLEMPFMYCGVNLVDTSSGQADVIAYTVVRDGTWFCRHYLCPDAAPLLRIWREQQVAYRPDLDEADPYGERANFSAPVRAVADVPFSHGTLAVSSPEPHAFTEEDLAALQDMAQVLSEGFRRVEDLQKLERQARAAEALAQAIATVAGTEDRDAVFRAVVNQAARMMSAERASLFLYDEEQEVLVPQAQTGHHWEAYKKVRLRPGEGMSGQVFATGRPHLSEGRDALFESLRPETSTLFDSALLAPRTGRAAAVPLLLNTKVVGTLSVASVRRQFEACDLDLLARLAEQAVVAMERARRTQSLQERNQELEREISERRQAEAAKAQLEAHLRQAQKMEAVGQLTAGIAHNFNNMLQGMMGHLELALLETPAPVQPDLKDARHLVQRAADMVRQLMLFSRPDSLQAFRPTDLARVIRDTIDICGKTFPRSIALECEAGDGVPLVQGDGGQLQQVFLTLLLNARDAVEEIGVRAPVVRVATGVATSRQGEPGRYVCACVSDNGVGMAEETRRRIFEPFFTTKPVGRGTGLGLAVVYGIVQQHQGWVECDSAPGQGTTFRVFLPVAQAEASQPEEEAGSAESPGAGQVVLVIDDEEAVRGSVARLLARGGYAVHEAADGAAGLALLGQEPVDLVLLDLSLPGQSGAEVLRQLRSRAPQVKVLIFTGYGARAEDLPGAAGVAHKPLACEELLRQVRHTLST